MVQCISDIIVKVNVVKKESLKNLSDNDLIILSKDNRDAEALLISRYIPLVNKYAFQFINVMDFDDLVQEGSLGLLDAISGFDVKKDAKFSSFAATCIRNKILKAVEKLTSKKQGSGVKSLPLDEALEQSTTLTPENIVIGKESLFTVLEDVKKVLSPLEREVLFLHLSGMEHQLIAKRLCIKEKSVDNALQRARKKLKQ